MIKKEKSLEDSYLKDLSEFITTNFFIKIPSEDLDRISKLEVNRITALNWKEIKYEEKLIFTGNLIGQELVGSNWPTNVEPGLNQGFFKKLVQVCDKNNWELTNRAGISFLFWIGGCTDCNGLKSLKLKRCTRCRIIHRGKVMEWRKEAELASRPQPKKKDEPIVGGIHELRNYIKSSVRKHKWT